MESAMVRTDRRIERWVLALMLLLAPSVVYAQGPRLQLDQLQRLAERASEVTDITLDPMMLQLASGLLSSDAGSADVKALIAGLKGVYVKSFEFEREGGYSEGDVNSIRKQLSAPGWTKIVSTQSKQDRENVDIYSWREGNQSGGLAILVAEPQELTVVNIVGQIDLTKLAALQGQFGIPKLPTFNAK
jgi:hypothetical protein